MCRRNLLFVWRTSTGSNSLRRHRLIQPWVWFTHALFFSVAKTTTFCCRWSSILPNSGAYYFTACTRWISVHLLSFILASSFLFVRPPVTPTKNAIELTLYFFEWLTSHCKPNSTQRPPDILVVVHVTGF